MLAEEPHPNVILFFFLTAGYASINQQDQQVDSFSTPELIFWRLVSETPSFSCFSIPYKIIKPDTGLVVCPLAVEASLEACCGRIQSFDQAYAPTNEPRDGLFTSLLKKMSKFAHRRQICWGTRTSSPMSSRSTSSLGRLISLSPGITRGAPAWGRPDSLMGCWPRHMSRKGGLLAARGRPSGPASCPQAKIRRALRRASMASWTSSTASWETCHWAAATPRRWWASTGRRCMRPPMRPSPLLGGRASSLRGLLTPPWVTGRYPPDQTKVKCTKLLLVTHIKCSFPFQVALFFFVLA